MEYKGFKIKGDGTFGYYNVGLLGSGTVPKVFSGVYTKPADAMKAIDIYRNSNPEKVKKEEKNGSTTSTSRGKQS